MFGVRASTTNPWTIAYWILFAGWCLGAAMTMGRVHGGFLTNYLSDLAFPPWFYIVMRGLSSGADRVPKLLRWPGRSPELAASSIFFVGVVSEVGQISHPLGLFAGTFDAWDIASYALGLTLCYALERRQMSASADRSVPS